MGVYGVKVEELVSPLEDFLGNMEGDVSAETMAKAWNKLAKKYKWKDKLKGIKKPNA
ncbi:unnamed protein product [marine sediment metagenome]|uniref:Uncharacterized protein n=1 Tax=marine sediment metagenome TaxID=412755 RepID=X0VQ30_9ZZZZ